MTWKCLQCGTQNLEHLDVCRTCGTGKDGIIKDQQRLNEWKSNNKVAQKTSEALNSIIISTGDIKEPYQIIDAIFALDNNSEGTWFVRAANPGKAFDGVKRNLRQLCHSLGGDAVINCQFEYRIALAQSIGDKTQVLEIFAYGTAVKLKKAEEEIIVLDDEQ